MDLAFKKLKDMGKNDVNSLLKWMKDSKIISNTREAEDKTRKLLERAKNLKNIDLDTFKNVIEKVAEDQHKKVEDLVKSLTDQGPKFMNTFQPGIGAYNVALADSNSVSLSNSISLSNSDSYSYSFSNSSSNSPPESHSYSDSD